MQAPVSEDKKAFTETDTVCMAPIMQLNHKGHNIASIR